MRFLPWILALLFTLSATGPANAAILRKKSGRAVIMGFSRTELESYSVGQYIVIENFEKNQWTGLIKKIYRVNRVRITLIDDDSEEMEVGEIFRIKPGEAPRSVARPEFDPNEVPPALDDGPDSYETRVSPPTPPPAPERVAPEAVQHDRLVLEAGLFTRYYIVPAGKQEGDLHGTGTQLQGTFLLQNRLGFHLGIRKEELVYTGIDQFSDYNVSAFMYFAGVSYSWHLARWTLSGGLRYLIQGKGSGSLQDTVLGADQQPINVLIRGIGELRETDLVFRGSYDWDYVSVFAETTLSISARYTSQYRYQLSAEGPSGTEILQQYRTESSYPMQVEGLTIGVSFAL